MGFSVSFYSIGFNCIYPYRLRGGILRRPAHWISSQKALNESNSIPFSHWGGINKVSRGQ